MTRRTSEPWSEHYTLRERMAIRRDLWRAYVRAWWDHELWHWIALHLPHKVVLWCFVRVMAHAWAQTNKAPNEVTYDEACTAWEER